MGIPVNTGLVELVDEKSSDKGFFCIKLAGYIKEEMDRTGDRSFDLWHKRFMDAKGGACAYSDVCPNYARTLAVRHRRPVQLSLKFQ